MKMHSPNIDSYNNSFPILDHEFDSQIGIENTLRFFDENALLEDEAFLYSDDADLEE